MNSLDDSATSVADAQRDSFLSVADNRHDPAISVADTRHGPMAYIRTDNPIGYSLGLYGEWAGAEIDLLARFIGLGSVVVDVGANIGTHAVAFAKRVGPTGRVLAFEPQEVAFNLLKRNLDAAGCGNVDARQAGVGRASGRALIESPSLDGRAVNLGAVRLSPELGSDTANESVEVVSLDDLDLPACHLIKVDAEGMEPEVVRGMAGTIARLRPVLLLECNTLDAAVATLAAHDWSGYRRYLLRCAAYRGANFAGNQKNVFGVARETGLLMVPDAIADAVDLPVGPLDMAAAEVLSVSTLDELAQHLIATPRYGDVTEHDRDAARQAARVETLRQELAAARAEQEKLRQAAEISAAAAREEAAAQLAAEQAQVRRLRAEVARLEFRTASLARAMRSEASPPQVGVRQALQVLVRAVRRSAGWRAGEMLRRGSRLMRSAQRMRP
jgi:FkbM family methyltransferase